MRPETIQKMNEIIEANVYAGFVRGQDLFVEALNEDLEKSTVLESVTVDGVMDYLLAEAIQNNQ